VEALPLRLTWRTWLRGVLAAFVALSGGVVALADDATWYVRIVGVVVFATLMALVLDVVVFSRSWDVDGRRWWVPTLASRGRIIPVDDQRVVELRHTYPARLRISGDKGARDVVLNPLVSVRDLDRWFDAIAAAPSPD